jgi:porphobilinogen deaminase
MNDVRPSLRLGTRGSRLALVQTGLVAARLREGGAVVETVIIETDGDRRAADTAWGEGAFVTAIEAALLAGQVDVAVHSAKDVPTDEDPRLTIAAFLPRERPEDVLVVRAGEDVRDLADLPVGARVGTDSPRRTAFLRALRPDLRVHPLHGNVDTRLRRLDHGETDALVLAGAGLRRLGAADRIAAWLPPAMVPPAPGTRRAGPGGRPSGGRRRGTGRSRHAPRRPRRTAAARRGRWWLSVTARGMGGRRRRGAAHPGRHRHARRERDGKGGDAAPG